MIWSKEEISKLENNLDKTTDELSIILNRDKRSIVNKIRRMNLMNIYKENNSEYKENHRRQKISLTSNINKKTGGYRKGSGRGKKGTYKGYWCDSSYELAWIIYNIEHKIKFKRNLEKFSYLHEGIKRNFIPDFIVDGIYYEIKGYKDTKLDSKLNYFPYKIKVLYLIDLKYIFDYVINKYTKNYISLYEDKSYTNECSNCDIIISKKSLMCISCNNKSRYVGIVRKQNKKYKEKRGMCLCGKEKSKRSKTCLSCKRINDRKVTRPTDDQLLNDIDSMGYSATGRKYSVSDNCIRKWIKKCPRIGPVFETGES